MRFNIYAYTEAFFILSAVFHTRVRKEEKKDRKKKKTLDEFLFTELRSGCCFCVASPARNRINYLLSMFVGPCWSVGIAVVSGGGERTVVVVLMVVMVVVVRGSSVVSGAAVAAAAGAAVAAA